MIKLDNPKEFKFWHLSRNPLFFEKVVEDVEWLSNVAHLELAPKGSTLYLPGDLAHNVYILKQGRVRISRLSEEGGQMTLALLDSGALFGEIALLDQAARHENIAEVLEDAYLCWIAKNHFEAFLYRHPDINLKVMKMVGQRMQAIQNQMEDLAFRTVEERLQRLLLKLSHDYGQPTSDGIQIGIKLTHAEIGHLINATRPTVSSMIKKLQQQELIQIIDRSIVVLPRLAQAV